MGDGTIYLDMVETFAFPRLEENEVQIFGQCETSSVYSNVFRILSNDTCSGASDVWDALTFGFRNHRIQYHCDITSKLLCTLTCAPGTGPTLDARKNRATAANKIRNYRCGEICTKQNLLWVINRCK
jgi:hypothetical protein